MEYYTQLQRERKKEKKGKKTDWIEETF